jgi:hypothetical protein
VNWRNLVLEDLEGPGELGIFCNSLFQAPESLSHGGIIHSTDVLRQPLLVIMVFFLASSSTMSLKSAFKCPLLR